MAQSEKKFNLRPEYLQVQCLNPFAAFVTGSRAAMFASEIGQAPPIANCEVKLIQSGMERDYGKYTDMIKMPADGLVQKVYNHYSSGMAYGNTHQPTTIIYQDMSGRTSNSTGMLPTYGVVHIPSHCQNHHVLGFDYVRTPKSKNLRIDTPIAEGTVLAHSPSLTEPGGEYRYGVNANLCFISLPETRQDGVILRKGFAEKIVFKGYEEVTLSFDGEEIPLNLYGNDEEYKIFPDVGEHIREDGIIFATRKLIDELYPVQMSRNALRNYAGTDKSFRFKGDGKNAKVISVEVWHSPEATSHGRRVPQGMEVQCRKYLEQQRRTAVDLDSFYHELCKRHGGKDRFQLTPELQNLMTAGLHLAGEGGIKGRPRTTLVENGIPLKEYTVKIKYSYDITPIPAHKMADGNGKRVC